MKNLLALLLILALSSTVLYAQQFEKMAYQAYLTNNKSLWKQLVSERQKAYDSNNSKENLYLLCLDQHGLLNATMVDQDEDTFDNYYEALKDNLEELIESHYQEANARALLSSVYGFEMGYSSWKGMFLGGKSSSQIEKALNMEASSPIVQQLYASSKFFTPEMFGGDKNLAVSHFEKSVALYEQGETSNNWRYLDALAWLGQAYKKTGQTEKARETFERALATEPSYGYARHLLASL